MSRKSKKKEFLEESETMEEHNELETIEEVAESPDELIYSVEQILDNNEEEIESVEEVPKPTINDGVEDNSAFGKVYGFTKIYVRSNPNKDAEPVGIVSDTDDISIDLFHSTNDFYKVLTSNGLEGYCLKECIKID